MTLTAVLRWPQMRGEIHRRLVSLLKKKIADGACTQESLARATGMHQTTISGILKKDKGTFDLDEAAAALAHVGIAFGDFAKQAPSPKSGALTVYDSIVTGLKKRDEVTPLVVALLGVP